MVSETLAPGVKVRETADRETPASSATCWALTKEREEFSSLIESLQPNPTSLSPANRAPALDLQ
jgi:hypothetical protein